MITYEDGTFAVMVHKLYAERVQNFLYSTSKDDWLPLSRGAEEVVAVDGPKHSNISRSSSNRPRVTVLDSPALTGVSQARRGYVLLLMEELPYTVEYPLGTSSFTSTECQRLFHRLPAMARQNISWVGRISHATKWTGHSSGSNSSVVFDQNENGDALPEQQQPTIGSILYKTSLQTLPRPRQTDMLLRVDCHPRGMVEMICRQLQQSARALAIREDNSEETKNRTPNDDSDFAGHDEDDPFEGPITMTMSRSKCTHRLTVIVIPEPEPNKRVATRSSSSSSPAVSSSLDNTASRQESAMYYWGLQDRLFDASVLELKLNHEAANDVLVVPADAAGNDDSHAIISTATPLSRAYYKLHQVWQEYLATETKWLVQARRDGVGLDLGASPGGWTQVLIHCVGLSKVVAVDAGIVARRALEPSSQDAANRLDTTDKDGIHGTLGVVAHVQSSMEKADLSVSQPYTMLVCDASVGWSELLDLIVATVQRCTWTLPSVAVITLKLPFKTQGSIHRHIHEIQETLPLFVRKMEQGMYSANQHSTNSMGQIHTRFQLVHLMANADSERTVIAIFEEAGGC